MISQFEVIMSTKLPNIYEYINYRQYLEDYRNAKRKVDTKFTHAYICTKLGHPNTRSFLSDIITGRKMLSSNFIDIMAEFLELEKNETHYFRALVYYNQAILPRDKDFYFAQVNRFKRTRFKILDNKAYQYYQNWYHSAIRLILDIYDFKNDYSELAGKLRPQITKEQAEESVALNSELGLVAYNDQGLLKSTDTVVSSGEHVQKQAIRECQMQCFELGKQAFHAKDPITNKALTLTLSASPDGFEQIIARLKQLKLEIASIVSNDTKKSEKVYQLNIQIFSISK